MSVFGFLPLKRLFTSEVEENYTWSSAAFGQVQTAFANFILSVLTRVHTHVCVYVYICVCMYISMLSSKYYVVYWEVSI